MTNPTAKHMSKGSKTIAIMFATATKRILNQIYIRDRQIIIQSEQQRTQQNKGFDLGREFQRGDNHRSF